MSQIGKYRETVSVRWHILRSASRQAEVGTTLNSFAFPAKAVSPSATLTSPMPPKRTTEMMPKIRLLALSLICLLASVVTAQNKPAADLIVTNAKVWTGDAAHPQAQSVAVIGDRIVAVGSDAEVGVLRGASTKVIDAGGKLIIPGFNDSHVHFVSASRDLDQVQLNDATSADEFIRRIRAQAEKTPKGSWMLGGGWDETKWTPPNPPTKEMIDSFTADMPVFLDRYDGHGALANSVALKMAGITAQTP